MHPDLIHRSQGESGPRLLFVDPYLNASHLALAQGLMAQVPGRWTLLGLSGRFFRWRMRGAAAFLADAAGDILQNGYDALVAGSMLNLAEFKGLVPALAQTPALAVFHENQVAYPAQGAAGERQQERDLFLAFSNLTTCQAAHRVVFNSQYHRQEFMAGAEKLLAALPDAVPPGLVGDIAAKSISLPVPLDVEPARGISKEPGSGPLRILWNHRWSQDKNPDEFFSALFNLAAQGAEFAVAVMGLKSGRYPAVFDEAASALGPRLAHLGPVTERREYWRMLHSRDLVVSTSLQEYFGLAVAEAIWAGCRPLLPDRLVYPSLYPKEFLYPPGQLEPALAGLIKDPALVRGRDYRPLAEGFTWQRQRGPWNQALGGIMQGGK